MEQKSMKLLHHFSQPGSFNKKISGKNFTECSPPIYAKELNKYNISIVSVNGHPAFGFVVMFVKKL